MYDVKAPLVVWSYLKRGEPLQRWLDQVGKVFLAHHPEAELRIEYCDRKILERLDDALQDNETLPDIVSQTKTWMEPYADRGIFADISGSLPTPAFESDVPWKETFNSLLAKSLFIEGQSFFIPQNLFVHAFHYNKNMFDTFRIDPPETWNQFESICNILKVQGITPIAIDGSFDLFNIWYFIRFAERLAGPENLFRAGDGEISFKDHPGFLKAAEYVSRFHQNGWFQKDYQNTVYPESHFVFCREQAAMVGIGGWFCAEMLDHFKTGMNVGIYPFPQVEGSVSPRHEEAWSNVFAVLKQSEHRFEAVNFLKVLTSQRMDPSKSALKSPSPLIDGTPVPELENINRILQNATGVGETYNGLSSRCKVWFDSVFKNLGTQLICDEVSPSEFIDQLDRKTKELYRT